MPQGLQVFDADGHLVLDTSSRIGRILGYVDAPVGAGSIVNASFAQGTPFYFVNKDFGVLGAYGPFELPSRISTPEVSFSGTTMSWTRAAPPDTDAGGDCRIYYGVY